MPVMMPRGLTAAFLLSMIVVASADRALLNKPSGGALHGVAFFGSNYYVTNGNGSWVPVPTSPDATPNSGWVNAQDCSGAATTTAATPTSLDQVATGLVTVAFPSRSLGVAVGASCFSSSNSAGTPNIIITLDQAQTWMAVTGLPTTTYAAAVATYTAATTNPVTGTTAAAIFPYPVVNTPDLVDVFFVTKSMGWAVGGIVASAQDQDDTGSAGAILMTSNGGTVWSNVLPLAAAGKLSVVPGCLMSVMSDSAGKNVYAVGAPAAVYPTAANPTLNTYGTILYSANSGASWTVQTAPAIAAYSSGYGLNSVFVQKGSTAWAVGGSITSPNSNGIILGTTNGGFSWTLMNFPSSGSGSAPAFTSIAYNGRAAWVGGYVDTASIYPTAATSTASAASYNVLISTDGKNFSPVTTSFFPAGFVKSALSTNDNNHVFGIVWDNNLRGFIYGPGFILSTKNSGNVWVYETPNSIIVNSASVTALANVPTSY